MALTDPTETYSDPGSPDERAAYHRARALDALDAFDDLPHARAALVHAVLAVEARLDELGYSR